MKNDNPYITSAARTLGGAKSEKKAAAARENGRKGGRPKRWFLDGDHWSIRALVRNSDGTVEPGRAYVRFEGERIYDLVGEETHPVPATETMGWGDLSGADMIEIGGGITHRAWFEELRGIHG